MSDEYLFIEEKISKNISKKIGNKLQLAELDIAKMEYGLSILFVDMFKLFFIYIVAFLLHIGIAVFITHLSFMMIRKTTLSYHASNSAVCTILSIFFLVILPFLTTFFEIALNRSIFTIVSLIIVGILGFQGVAIAQKRVKSFKNGKIRIISMVFLLIGIGLIQSSDQIRTLIFLGMAIATFLMFVKKFEGKNQDDQKSKRTSI